jgi:hypothetical protein
VYLIPHSTPHSLLPSHPSQIAKGTSDSGSRKNTPVTVLDKQKEKKRLHSLDAFRG